MHELAERVLGEPGDPEQSLVAVDTGPVVLAVVFQVVGIRLLGGQFTPPSCRSAWRRSWPREACRARRSSIRYPAPLARRARSPSPCRGRAWAGACRGAPPRPLRLALP